MRIAMLTLTGILYSLLAYLSYNWITNFNGLHPLLSIAVAVAVTLVTVTALKETPQ